MDNANMARVLQNMIDEAEENICRTEKILGWHLEERRADLAEAVKLVEELGQPTPAEQGVLPGPYGNATPLALREALEATEQTLALIMSELAEYDPEGNGTTADARYKALDILEAANRRAALASAPERT